MPDVIAQVRSALPPGWKACLNAVDGANTRDIEAQLAKLSRDASHLVLSIGGNDALATEPILRAKAGTVAEALTLLSGAARTSRQRHEERMPQVTIETLDLALGLGVIVAAQLRREAVMPSESHNWTHRHRMNVSS